MNVTRVTIERIGPNAQGIVVAAHVEGKDLSEGAIPLVVKFGNVTARSVVPLGIAAGVRAVFSEMPAAGAPLFIGYADRPLNETSFKFVPPDEIPIA